MRRLFYAAVAATALTLSTSASAETPEYPSMNLRLAHFVPSTFPAAQVDQWFADEVRERSGGKINIRIFWSESLGRATELIDLVGSGAVDMALTSPGYFPDRLPLFGATNSIMMQFDGNAEATRVMPAMVQEFESVQNELRNNNVYPISFHGLSPYRPFCTKPIETIDDFQGLKIRSWGEYIPLMWESLGATPVSVMTPDLYESLQRGVVDCVFYPLELIWPSKLYEVAKFTWAGDNHFGAIPTSPLWVNWDTWHNRWPENVRELLTEVGQEAMERDITMVHNAAQEALRAMVEDHGVQIVEFSDMDKVHETVPDLVAIWVEKMKSRGLEDQALKLSSFWQTHSEELKGVQEQ